MPIGGSAILSPCGQYRYRLEREVAPFGRVAAIVMVNPSTATAETDDHTISKWIGFSRPLGLRKLVVGNKFAFRATDVSELGTAADPIGLDNDKHLEQIMRDADVHIVAWGTLGKLPKRLRTRWWAIIDIAAHVGCPLYCLGIAKDKHPLHPLMLSYKTPLREWSSPP